MNTKNISTWDKARLFFNDKKLIEIKEKAYTRQNISNEEVYYFQNFQYYTAREGY